VTKLQKENRQLMKKVERLEVADSTFRGEYKKARRALEFVMELVEDMGKDDLKKYLKGATSISLFPVTELPCPPCQQEGSQ